MSTWVQSSWLKQNLGKAHVNVTGRGKVFKKPDPQTLPLHIIKVVPNFFFLLYSLLFPDTHYQSPFFYTEDFLAGVSHTLCHLRLHFPQCSLLGEVLGFLICGAEQSTEIAFFTRDPGVQCSVSSSRHHRRFLWLWSHLQSTAVESPHDP